MDIKIGDYLVRISDRGCGQRTKRCTFFRAFDVNSNNERMSVKYLKPDDMRDYGDTSGWIPTSSFRLATNEEVSQYESDILKNGEPGVAFAVNMYGDKFHVGDCFVFDGSSAIHIVEKVTGVMSIKAHPVGQPELVSSYSVSLDEAYIVSTKSGDEMELYPEYDFETIFGG